MDLILILILLITSLLALLPFFKKKAHQIERDNIVNKIPGPSKYPVLGTTLPYIMLPREGILSHISDQLKLIEVEKFSTKTGST